MAASKMININDGELKYAAYEAIYAWIRVEGFYHNLFNRLAELDSYQVFTDNVVNPFVGEFSVKRTLRGWSDSKKRYLFVTDLINTHQFFDNIFHLHYFGVMIRKQIEITLAQ